MDKAQEVAQQIWEGLADAKIVGTQELAAILRDHGVGSEQPYYAECNECGHEATAIIDSKCHKCGKGRMVPRDI